MKKILRLLVLCVVALSGFQKTERLKPHSIHTISLEEPSGICRSALALNSFYMVSNRGCIAETDEHGKIIRRTKYDGSDFEDIFMADSLLYVIDESLRKIEVLHARDFSLVNMAFLPFHGPRNAGFESISLIPDQKKIIAITEDPVVICELDEQLRVTRQVSFKQFGEVSSVTYHDNYLWFLSDRNHEVMQVNPADYKIVKRWKIPVINPEGICFDATGELLVLSDDMGMLFRFKIPL